MSSPYKGIRCIYST